MMRWSYVLVSVTTLLTAIRASVSSFVPWNSAGYSIDPTPRIKPCPSIKRGTEWTVPMVPGLVSETVVPAKSSTVSPPERAFLISDSYVSRNCAKSIDSQPLMEGTRSWRVPSDFARSIAIPIFIWSGLPIAGLPSIVV